MSEPAGSEAAKFRLWVKSKGLALRRPGLEDEEEEEEEKEAPLLYVPTGTDKVRGEERGANRGALVGSAGIKN